MLAPRAEEGGVRFMITPSASSTRLIVAAVLSSALAVYAWHALTLGFASYLVQALAPVVGTDDRFTFTDLFGAQFAIWDPYAQPPAAYETFVRTAGDGVWFGIGATRDRLTGLETWLGWSLVCTTLLMVGGLAIGFGLPWLAARRVRRNIPHSPIAAHHSALPSAAWLSIILLPLGMLACWHCSYPRSRFGQGVFEMHDMLRWRGPAVALAVGLLGGMVQLFFDWQVRRPRRQCLRCGFPSAGPRIPPRCTDCGFDSDPARIAGILAWRLAKYGAAALLIVGTLVWAWMSFAPYDGVLGREFLSRWLLLRPLAA